MLYCVLTTPSHLEHYLHVCRTFQMGAKCRGHLIICPFMAKRQLRERKAAARSHCAWDTLPPGGPPGLLASRCLLSGRLPSWGSREVECTRTPLYPTPGCSLYRGLCIAEELSVSLTEHFRSYVPIPSCRPPPPSSLHSHHISAGDAGSEGKTLPAWGSAGLDAMAQPTRAGRGFHPHWEQGCPELQWVKRTADSGRCCRCGNERGDLL